MVYVAEAVMPTDLEHNSPRVVNYTEAANDLARQDGVDQLDEARDLSRSRTAIYQHGIRRYHSWRVRTRTFQESASPYSPTVVMAEPLLVDGGVGAS